jgi:GntR family transcriptional regulator, transcriptional repressor for pyruvate dehydrogenase complex
VASSASSRIEVQPAYAVVVDHLRRAIHLGEYGPGDKFPPERQHADELGVSRVTLRGAIRVLEGEGLVETRRGAAGGVMVRAPAGTREQIIRRLRERMDELLAIQEFRLVNERLAAERAAIRVTEADLEALELSTQQLGSATGIGPFRQADSAFHLRIAAAADSPLVQEAVARGRAEMFLPLDALGYELMLADTLKDHRRILAALHARDAKRAGTAMAAHLRRTRRELAAILGGA